MLSRPITRCPLWQRPLCATSDAIWVAEDTTSETFQRFSFLSRLSRRRASSVPGPMESRRRVGKRRLGNLSEVSQSPMQRIGAIWDNFETEEKSRWQWEGPSKRQDGTAETARLQLPAWLSDYEPLPEEKQVTTFEEELPSSAFQPNPSTIVETDVRQFRKAIKEGLPHQIPTLCDSFNYRYQHNIMLGLVSGDDLSANLRELTADIREVTTDEALAMSRCLSLCLATWEGIKASKVLGPSSLESGVIDGLLMLLGDLPSLLSVQTLATDIVNTPSIGLIGGMEQGVLAVVKAWLSSWRHLAKINANHDGTELISDESVPNAGAFQSLNDSVRGLTKFLGLLPPHMADAIVSTATDYITSAYYGAISGPVRVFRTLRYSWMSVVANTPCVNEELLVRTWSTMDLLQLGPERRDTASATISRLQLRESCKLLLDFWISHGHLKAPEDVRATFYATITRSSREDDVSHLLQAIIKHREDFGAKIRSLLWVMRRVWKPQAIYDIFMVLLNVDIRVPASLLTSEIKEMSRIDVRWAWRMYKLCPNIRYDDATPPRLENCPELVIAMIKCPDIHPNNVWRALNMRPYDPQWLSSSSKTLAWERASLVHKMALAFAQAESLSPRVALRNVTHCIRYLRQHQLPLGPVLSRALSHAGILRDLLRDRWLGTTRVLYILDFVRQVEGREVSTRMDEAMHAWQCEYHERQKQANRARNPLRHPRVNG